MKLDDYIKRYNEFTKIDDFNMDQRLKSIPNEKHFWVVALITTKKEKFQLLKKKKKLKQALTEKVLNEGLVSFNKKTLDELENSDKFEDLNDSIQELDFLIEYLEHIVKNITYINQDMKNILVLKEMQE